MFQRHCSQKNQQNSRIISVNNPKVEVNNFVSASTCELSASGWVYAEPTDRQWPSERGISLICEISVEHKEGITLREGHTVCHSQHVESERPAEVWIA